MLAYVTRRILLLLLVLVGVTAITFVLSHMIPASPVEMMLGSRPTAAEIQAARVELGLDHPLPVQFLRYVLAAIHGRFGISMASHQPVLQELVARSGATIELTVLALLVAVLAGVPAGVLAAVRHGRSTDGAIRFGAAGAAAVPQFFAGILLQMIFNGWLGWLPLQGQLEPQTLVDHPLQNHTGILLLDAAMDGNGFVLRDAALHLVLPVAALSLGVIALIIRMTRATMSEVLLQDYIKTLRALGLPQRKIIMVYALKATFIPLLTVIGLTFGYVLGGSVVIEYLFDWPGLGGYAVNAVTNADYPAVIGVTLMLATAYLVVNLIVDLLYFLIDPRIALQ